MISGPGFKPAPASWSLSVSSSLVLLFVFTLPPTGTLEKIWKCFHVCLRQAGHTMYDFICDCDWKLTINTQTLRGLIVKARPECSQCTCGKKGKDSFEIFKAGLFWRATVLTRQRRAALIIGAILCALNLKKGRQWCMWTCKRFQRCGKCGLSILQKELDAS